jgi:hypothetical protein
MGCWGVKAYDNDSAADWFGDLWEDFPVPARIEGTLKLDIEDSHEEIRAAAYVLVQLAEIYIWPIEDLDRHCELAAQRLEEIKKMEIYEGEDFQREIQTEIDELRSRISKK